MATWIEWLPAIRWFVAAYTGVLLIWAAWLLITDPAPPQGDRRSGGPGRRAADHRS